MSTYRLDRLFAPRSVALVGASPRGTSVARTILKNLCAAGFEGSVHLVNPHYAEIDGIVAVNSIADLPTVPTHTTSV
jgi:acetyltransferase